MCRRQGQIRRCLCQIGPSGPVWWWIGLGALHAACGLPVCAPPPAVMEKENEEKENQEEQGRPPPPSNASRSKRTRSLPLPSSLVAVQTLPPRRVAKPSSQHHGQGHESAASRSSHAVTPSASPSAAASISVAKEKGLEIFSEEEDVEDDDNSFDHEDELSESLLSADGGSQEGDGDEVSKTQNVKRGGKRLKAGVHLSPSKCKVKRGKRANWWKYFKEITIASKKELGVMVTKAKCKFCHKAYVYHPRGATSQLNQHLDKCTPY